MRRTTRAAEAAAAEASNAARVLAQRSHESKSEAAEPVEQTEPRSEATTSPDRIEKLLNARPHERAMDEIASKRGLDIEEEPKPAVEAATEPKVEPEVKTEIAAPVTETVAAEAPKTVRVKVDGQEFDAPAEEVEEAGGLKSYQIQKANENRLAKTNATLEETRKLQAQMADWLQKQPKAEAKPELSDLQYIAERMQKVRFGTDEESAQAQLEINQRINKPVDRQAITSEVRAQIDHDQAVKKFDTEFADVVKNPMLLDLVLVQRQKLINQSQGKFIDWDNAYRTIGNQIRSLVGRQSQPAPVTDAKTGTTSQPSDKEARKASIVNLPTAAARAELPKEEKELTPEEERKQWIADAKKSRGQG